MWHQILLGLALNKDIVIQAREMFRLDFTNFRFIPPTTQNDPKIKPHPQNIFAESALWCLDVEK